MRQIKMFMSDSITKYLSPSWADFKKALWDLVAFDIIFKVIVAVLFTPFTSWVFHRLISLSGNFVISNEKIVSFLLSPQGMVALFFAGLSAWAIYLAEQSGLMILTHQVPLGGRPPYVHALYRTLRSLPRLFELGIRQLVIFILWVAPLIALGTLDYLMVTAEHDINYVLTSKPPVYWIGAVIAAILAVALLLVTIRLFLRWIFATVFCLYEDMRPKQALKASREMAKGHAIRMGTLLVGWNIAVLVAGLFIGIVVKESGGLFFRALGESLALVVPAVSFFLVIFVLLMAGLSFIGIAGNALLVTRFYREFHGKDVVVPPAIEVDKIDQRKWSKRKALWAGVVLILLASGVVSFLLLESVEMDHHVAVTAHRGSSHNAPENTLAALERAIEDGADYAEIDVQETADGVIVVIHDTDLMRIAGVNKKIWNVAYDEIEGLDVGSWFSPEFKEERIPTLEKMIDLAEGRIKLNIELKLTGHEKNLVQTVLKIIQDRGFRTSCFISSLDAEVLRKVRELDPSMRLGQIVFRALGQLTRIEKDILCLHSGIATRNTIASAQKKGKEVHVWTVNNPKQMAHFVDLGVDNILTDVPDVLVALREERKEMTDVERFLLAARLWF